ncbi:hypothetical protein N7535_005633 [Penicillium sp. DV-2018c]|nr:hypothetical protein N7461_009207 [Penicillium sp. DV-2018c]KAJ5571973.1 hypothetical protein N7535_005633 [Penicillium sp. DV-2018c]
MAGNDLKQTLTPTLLQDVHELWFKHLDSDDSFILPGWTEMGKWFERNEEFDKLCLAKFQPALETIVASKASAKDVISAINPSSPLDWVSLIILLDQIPRNCYRGDESKVVFGLFDPIVENIALQAFAQGIPTQSPYYRYRMAYRNWFHMPLMHSEDLAVHEQAAKVHEDTAKDMEEFLARDPESLSEEEKPCFKVLSEKAEALKALLSATVDYEERHKVIIERFGRYPHRNQALGREPTPEEIEYLRNGGETFG